MKSIENYLKSISVFLSAIILFHNCSPSYSGSYSLMDAYNSKRETRITTVNHEKFKYSKIDTINGKFVGQKHINNQIVNEPIIVQAITRVELKKTKESRNDEALFVILVIVTIVGIILSFTDDDFCYLCDDY